MRELSAERRRALEILCRSYREQLPERLRQIEAALEAYESGDRSRGDGLYRLVHTLAGSAAIYGFDGVSRRVLALERAILRRLNDPGRDAAPLRPLLDAVRMEIAATASGA